MFNSSPLTAAQSAEEVKTGAAATPAAGAGARPRHVAIIMDGNGRAWPATAGARRPCAASSRPPPTWASSG